MKTFLPLAAILWLSILLQACRDDENLSPGEKIQFSFDFKSIATAGGRAGPPDLMPGTFLQISMVTHTGEVIFDHTKIELLMKDDLYCSAPLALAPGEYKITDFMLVNSHAEVEYVTPRHGSAIANNMVSHPLPFSLTVSKNKTLNIAIEIVDVRNSDPEDFGYTSFYTTQAEGIPLQIGILTGDDPTYTEAEAFIIQDKDTIHTYSLEASINTIYCTAEPGLPCTLAVVKDGYALYTREFNITDLLQELDHKPLSITLKPALTLIKLPDSTNLTLDFEVKGRRSFTVNWGDGSTTTFTPDHHRADLSHHYAHKGKYFISITGDLGSITKLYSHYGTSGFERLTLIHLQALEVLGFVAVEGLSFIDFSQNSNLSNVSFENCHIKGFDASKNTKLSSIHLWGCTAMSTGSIDTIINDVYNNVVSNNLRNGKFLLHNTNQPSQKSVAKLKDLKRIYNWWVL